MTTYGQVATSGHRKHYRRTGNRPAYGPSHNLSAAYSDTESCSAQR
jgi:hypothetical protein